MVSFPNCTFGVQPVRITTCLGSKLQGTLKLEISKKKGHQAPPAFQDLVCITGNIEKWQN